MAMLDARTRCAVLVGLLVLAAGCGGGGGGATPQAGAPSPAPSPAPAPAPSPAPPGGRITVTLHNQVTAGDVTSGPVYGRVGTRAYLRSEINAKHLLCGGQLGSRSCSVDLAAGETLTLAAVEVTEANLGQIPSGGFASPGWFKSHWQFVSWSAPCTEPDRGVCVLQPAADTAVTVLWKPLAVTTLGYVGLREWRVHIDAPPLLGIGSVHTGLRQVKSHAYPAQLGHYCLGGPAPKDCYVVQAPDTAQITLEALPPALATAPAGATVPLAFKGWGGACMGAGGAATCTLVALGEQSAWFRWEYYSCVNAGGTASPGWGLSGWRYASTPADCSLQSP